MRAIVLVLLLVGCASNPESQLKRELGWNAIIQTYVTEAQKCTPVQLPTCLITPDKARVAKTAIENFRTARTLADVNPQGSVCEMAQSLNTVATLVLDQPTIDISTACSGNADVESILSDLEAL